MGRQRTPGRELLEFQYRAQAPKVCSTGAFLQAGLGPRIGVGKALAEGEGFEPFTVLGKRRAQSNRTVPSEYLRESFCGANFLCGHEPKCWEVGANGARNVAGGQVCIALLSHPGLSMAELLGNDAHGYAAHCKR
jgi:hypothetical protein